MVCRSQRKEVGVEAGAVDVPDALVLEPTKQIETALRKVNK